MKKLFTLIFFSAFMTFSSSAQLPDGSIAPNFTVTDLEGNTYTLYDILDQGKSVIIDLSATWCGPCWAYHESGALESLYELYGPDGTDELMVFMIEGDESTNLDCIYNLPGCNSITLGDWTVGTNYPIVNDDTIADLYNLSYWPTIYHICPNRLTTEIPQSPTEEIYELNSSCAVAFGSNNAGLLNYQGFSGSFCESETFAPTVSIQNLGSNNLTTATLELLSNGVLLQKIDWTGDLATFQIGEVNFGDITITEDVMIEIVVSTVNGSPDEDESNNKIEKAANLTLAITDQNMLTLEIRTDPYPGETYWEIVDREGKTYYSGGNDVVVGGTDGSGSYTIQNNVYTHEIPMPSDGCFEFIIYDSYGDGICCIEGDGYYKITDSNGTEILNGGEFEFESRMPFSLSGASTINNNGSILSSTGIKNSNCGISVFTPTITVQNLGANEITSANIEVKLGEEVLFTQLWTGSILTSETGTIEVDPITVSESALISIGLKEINNVPDNFSYKNEIITDFTRNYTESSKFLLDLQLDSYAYEIYWQLTNSSGDVLYSGGNEIVGPDGGGNGGSSPDDPGAYAASEWVIVEFNLPADKNDCYEFLLVDSYGDGVVDGGGGHLKIFDADGEILIEKNLDEYRFSSDQTLLDVNPFITSVNEVEDFGNLLLYPNPTSDEINISFDIPQSMPLKISIYNLLGQPVKVLADNEFNAGKQNLVTSVRDLPSGVYTLHLENQDKIITHRFNVSK